MSKRGEKVAEESLASQTPPGHNKVEALLKQVIAAPPLKRLKRTKHSRTK